LTNSDLQFKKFLLRLTAAGTAPDLNRIPFFITHPRHGTSNTEKHGKDRESDLDIIYSPVENLTKMQKSGEKICD